jgi:glycosyltransferase involved in cell wall biosynthesis
MRILVITNLYPTPMSPHRGRFNERQFRALAEGHAVRIICPIAWTDEFRLGGGHVLVEENRRVIRDGIEIAYPRFVFTPRLYRRFYGSLLAAQIRPEFRRAVDDFQPDVVLGSWAYPDGWAAVKLAQSVNLPVAIKAHGSDLLGLAEIRGRDRKTREALRRADAVIAVSENLRQRAVQLGAGADRVHLVSNGVDAGIFHPGDRDVAKSALGLNDPRPIVLFVGNLVPGKGIDVLIAACHAMHREGVEFACHIIGGGSHGSRIRRMIRGLDLPNQFFLHEAMAQERLADWYRAANVVALPTLSEGRPNVLLEAAACGTPFVASDVGDIPEISAAYLSRLVAPGDSAALSRAIVELLHVPRPAVVPRFATHCESANELVAALGKAIVQHRRAEAAHALVLNDARPEMI